MYKIAAQLANYILLHVYTRITAAAPSCCKSTNKSFIS